MYPHFIEVHAKKDEAIMSINIDNIVGFGETGENSTIITSDNGRWVIRESYDKLKQLITNSGASIQMGDPRLDTSHPLTMKELKRMIGEPIWNSNARCWMLVGEDIGQAVMLTYNAGNSIDYTEDDLIKYPLYRMKVE